MHPSSSTNLSVALAILNMTNLVTIQPAALEDYLMWHIQFMTLLLVSHGLLRLMDGSYPLSSSTITASSGHAQPNPDFYDWLCAEQSVKSWLIFMNYLPPLRFGIVSSPIHAF